MYVEPTLEMVDNHYAIVGAIRSRYALITDDDIREVLELLEHKDAVNHMLFNAQVDAEWAEDE